MSPEEQDVYDVLVGVLAELGGIAVEEEPLADNLMIALVTYFEEHMECPGGPIDEEGWNEWAVSKAGRAIELIREGVLHDVRAKQEEVLALREAQRKRGEGDASE